MTTYRYTLEGTADRDQTWKTEGTIQLEQIGDFPRMLEQVAIYGKPGIGCIGPYRIKRFLVEVDEG